MTPTTHEPSQDERGRVRDTRTPPRGVLPRQVQTWLMVGLAVVIVLVILITGHSQPPARSTTGARPTEPTLAPADRIRTYAQQLAEEDARLRDAASQPGIKDGGLPTAGSGPTATAASEEQRRREEQSLFADNVALSRRPPGQQPFASAPASTTSAPTGPTESSASELALLDRLMARPAVAQTPSPARVDPPSVSAAAPTNSRPAVTTPDTPPTENPAPGERRRLLEGTVIEAALVNRLDGTFAGPVVCLVTTPVYTHDRQAVLIPTGARLLGASAPVQGWGDSRLAVTFHRLVMPDGHSYSLNQFKGLNQTGEGGLRDSVNRHYLQVFGASLAIGALSGLAQYGTRSGANAYDFNTEYRQATGASLATSANRVLDRYLNVLPTLTVREGTRVKVYLTNDMELPAYAPTAGGIR